MNLIAAHTRLLVYFAFVKSIIQFVSQLVPIDAHRSAKRCFHSMRCSMLVRFIAIVLRGTAGIPFAARRGNLLRMTRCRQPHHSNSNKRTRKTP